MLIFFVGNFCLLCHISTLRWSRYMKFIPMEDKDLFILVGQSMHLNNKPNITYLLVGQCCGYWWPGNTRSQAISSHGIDLAPPLPPGIISWMHPANKRRCYIVTSSLIGWAHSQNDPCTSHHQYYRWFQHSHHLDWQYYSFHSGKMKCLVQNCFTSNMQMLNISVGFQCAILIWIICYFSTSNSSQLDMKKGSWNCLKMLRIRQVQKNWYLTFGRPISALNVHKNKSLLTDTSMPPCMINTHEFT